MPHVFVSLYCLQHAQHYTTHHACRRICWQTPDSRLTAAAAAAAAGATIQVLLFAIMAVEIKRKAPTCHTVLEVVRVRNAAAAAASSSLVLI
jgi:hypothetical protein